MFHLQQFNAAAALALGGVGNSRSFVYPKIKNF